MGAVRADPSDSREMILASPGTPREKAAFNARWRPSFGPCLQQGFDAKLNKPTIFAVIAEALYRLSAQPASSAGMH